MTSYINFFWVAFVKLILEVFGASGAIWGTSEVLTLRNPDTQEIWRYISSIIGIIFFIRFLFIQKKLYKKIHIEENISENIDF
jgi:membrane associated rhomboid family serine protease